MSHNATIRWSNDDAEAYLKGQYSRAHHWSFDGGAMVPASSSPAVVPLPWSDAAAVDPEEAFVASLSSCHMLFFLDFARRAKFAPAVYEDAVEGVLAKGDDGAMRIGKVTLRPRIEWTGDAPDAAALDELHHKAHKACFIANSVTSEVAIEAR